MSARSEFPKFTNPQALRAGLVLQASEEIDANEFALEQGTLRFVTFNENLKRFQPKRGTPCPKFKAGDEDTLRALRLYDYLGAQTSRKIRDGQCPGIGVLEVLCQGAVFDLTGKYPIYDPAEFSILPSTSVGSDLVAPTGSLTKSTTVFKFAARAAHQMYVGLTPGNVEIALVNVALGVQSVNVSGIPIDGRKIYVRLITSVDPPSGGGTSTERSYVFNTDPSGGAPAATQSADALNGKGFGPITQPLFETSSTLQSVTLPMVRSDEENVQVDMIVDYHAIDLHYEYVARDRSQRPRFLTSSYAWNEKTDMVSIPAPAAPSASVGGGGPGPGPRSLISSPVDLPAAPRGGGLQMQLLIDRIALRGTKIASNASDNFLASWRDRAVLIGAGARFEQTPAGPYFHVLETASIQIASRFV